MSSSKNIILTTPEDWEPWLTQLREFSNHEIWPHIDPETEFLPEDTQELLDEPTEPKASDINAQATRFDQLTPAEQTTFDRSWKYYEHRWKRYEKQREAERAIRSYISTHVSDHKLQLLDENQTTTEWLVKLKEATQLPDNHMRQRIQERYIEALKGLKAARINQWLDRWERAIQDMDKYNLRQKDHGMWLIDLARAIRPLSDNHYHKYCEQADRGRKAANISQYLKVSMYLRTAFQTPAKTATNIARGSAFSTEFAGEPEEDITSADDPKGGQKSTDRSRKRAGTTSIEKEKTTKKSKRSKCAACEMRGHELSNCWYLFEDKRPDDFKISEEKMDKIQKKIEKDSKLAALIEKVKLAEGDES